MKPPRSVISLILHAHVLLELFAQSTRDRPHHTSPQDLPSCRFVGGKCSERKGGRDEEIGEMEVGRTRMMRAHQEVRKWAEGGREVVRDPGRDQRRKRRWKGGREIGRKEQEEKEREERVGGKGRINTGKETARDAAVPKMYAMNARTNTFLACIKGGKKMMTRQRHRGMCHLPATRTFRTDCISQLHKLSSNGVQQRHF